MKQTNSRFLPTDTAFFGNPAIHLTPGPHSRQPKICLFSFEGEVGGSKIEDQF